MNATLTAEQLDEVYTRACRAMTELGEARGELFLARLALLLMKQVGDADRIAGAIDTARRSIEAG
jgi:Protein of unknown function (DUF2783)